MDNLAQQWREAAAKVAAASATMLTLPSGASVRARRPDIHLWLLHGRLPTAIAAALAAVKESRGAEDVTNEQIAALGRFCFDVVTAAVVEPRIVAGEPKDGEISYAELPPEDVQFLFGWATRQEEAAAAATFRLRAEHAAAGDHGAVVRSAAKRTRRDRGPRDGG